MNEINIKYLGPNCSVNDYVIYISDFSGLNKYKKAIWQIIEIYKDKVILRNINSGNQFTTTLDKCVRFDYVKKLEIYKTKQLQVGESALAQYELNTKETIDLNQQRNKKVNTIKVDNIVSDNVDAVKVAASITTGRALNKLVINKIRPQLPMMVRGYADTFLGEVVAANVANFIVTNVAPQNKKAAFAADAMMKAAMVNFLDSFDLEKIIAEITASVELPVSE